MTRAAALGLAAVALAGCGGGPRYTLDAVNRCFNAAGWEGGLDKGPADARAVALGQFQRPGSDQAWYVTLERSDADARHVAASTARLQGTAQQAGQPFAVRLRRRNATLSWFGHLPTGADLAVIHRCFPES